MNKQVEAIRAEIVRRIANKESNEYATPILRAELRGLLAFINYSLPEEPSKEESEDEIHRKWILEYLYDGLRKASGQFKDHFKSAIAYLERQKAIDKNMVEEIKKGFEQAMMWGRAGYKINPNGKAELLSQDEIDAVHEKLAENKEQMARSAASEWCRCWKCDGNINDTQSQCVKPNVTCLKWRDAYRATKIALGKFKVAPGVEVKIAEDRELQRHQDELYSFKVFATKQAREHHISFVHDFEWNNFCEELLSYFNENIACCKALPERFNFQPKQEWGEFEKPNWKRAKAGTVFSGEALVIGDDGEARLSKVAVNDCKYILVKDTLPKEWSEEDETRRNCCMIYLAKARDCIEFNQNIGDNARERGTKEIQKDINWLKNLSERFNLQPKQEWSEEDEKCLQEMIRYIEHCVKVYGASEPKWQQWLNFLKSLRPQPQGTYKQVIHTIFGMLKDKDFYEIRPSHRVSLLNDIRVKCKDAIECAPILDEPCWKPSEEQMEALMLAIEGKCPAPTSYMSRRLEDLYEGLANTYNVECELTEEE